MNTDRQLLEDAASGWVRFNHLTQTYDTKDGTAVGSELVDNANCLADMLHIAIIRDKQRAAAAIGRQKEAGNG